MLQVYMKAWDTANSRWVNVVCDTSGRILTTFPRGRKPTDVLDAGGVTDGDLFDWLKGYIPDSGDRVIVSGGIAQGDRIYVASYAERYDSTTIYFWRIIIDTVNQDKYSGCTPIDKGSAYTWDQVSLSI